MPPQYEGDLVLGSFNFTATLDPVTSTCPGLPDGGFASDAQLSFSGVFSVASQSQTLFLRVNELDRQGTVTAGHFVLVPPFAVERDLGCGLLDFTETLTGDFTGPTSALDGGACETLYDADGGCIAPNHVTGFLEDMVHSADGGGVQGGGGCAYDAGPSCLFRYVLQGVRQ